MAYKTVEIDHNLPNCKLCGSEPKLLNNSGSLSMFYGWVAVQCSGCHQRVEFDKYNQDARFKVTHQWKKYNK